ncbi:MAG: diguanylate cyclase [Thermoguttaceae bacterium]|nr:diguanylate cyclase [Thermoguttaceae bacterium]MDW8038961.1 diguanylate cyclase [Thermoguttaceae bacterium]
MTLVVLTLGIAVLNLAVGYAAAVLLGFGPPTLRDAWTALVFSRWGRVGKEDSLWLRKAAAQPIEALLDGFETDITELQPDVEPYDEDLAELLQPDQPEYWDLNEKYVETSILKLNIAMIKSGLRTQEIDMRLRAVAGRTDLETIRRSLEELKEDCQRYLEQQREAAERFAARISELGELRSLGEEIELANLEQAAQLETTLSNLQHMDFESDLEAANRRLLSEIHNLRVARHWLRDMQEAAFLAVARYEGRLENIERQLWHDPLTRLRSRIGLEVALAEWWKQSRHQTRQISGLLLDLDGFGKVNEKYGSLIGDRVLVHVADWIKKNSSPADLVGRFAGECFLVMMPDVGPRAAIKHAELLRQTLEKMTFRTGEESFRLTLTGAVVEVRPEDSDEQVLRRLQETLREAKRTGRNRIFFHNGRQAEPVEAPNLGAQECEIIL